MDMGLQEVPGGTTVADLHSLAAVASWLDKEQDATSTMTTTPPPHDIPPYIRTVNDDDDDDGQQQSFFDHSGAV